MAFRMACGGVNRGNWVNPAAGFVGYTWVKNAISMRGVAAEMEFAAALISADNWKQDQQGHAEKARAGMKKDPLLAQNIASHF